jgi:hypothetical protein
MTSASMDDGINTARRDELDRLESHLRNRCNGRVRNLRLMHSGEGIVLYGIAHSYYAKQLAQHALMEATELAIVANQIEVV